MDVALIGLLGVVLGGLGTAFFQHHFGFKKEIREKEHTFKEVRYKAIVLLMYSKVYPENIEKVLLIRPDLKTIEDIDEELKSEFLNSFLFASDVVLKSFQSFLNNPSKDNLIISVNAMRKDLWGSSTRIEKFLEIKTP